MAKYVSNYSNHRNNTQYCAILDENCLANTYTVRFNNGTIKNVPKRKVVDLDALDEGVLDRLKELGHSLLDKVVKAGKYMWFTVSNKVAKVFSPLNLCAVAESIEGLSFVPSPQTAEMCNAVGIQPKTIIDEEDDLEFLADANAYWGNIIDAYERGEIDEPEIHESLSGKYVGNHKLYEAKAHPDIKMEHASWDNVSRDELVVALTNQFNLFRAGAGLPGEEHPIPYCVWGAPGVGKTEIINSIIDVMRDKGYPANMMSLNALTMRKDDTALPGIKQISHKIKNSEGIEIEFTTSRAADLPKSWLPVYDPNDAEQGLTLEQLDDIANGGDGSGNGEGGFIFLDELSRIELSVMNVFMTLVQSRTFNGMILGSKWMFVAAANRTTDMGAAGEMVEWEAAYTGRFTHLNFVPTFKEWLEWAKKPIVTSKSTKDIKRKLSKSLSALTKKRHDWLDKSQKIHPDYIDFLETHPGFWYNSLAYNDEDDKDKVSQTMYPNGRGWANTSKERRGYEYAQYLLDNPDKDDTFIEDMYKGLGITSSSKLNIKDKARFLRRNVGNKAAAAYTEYSKINVMTPKDARTVWLKGDSASVPYASNLSSDGAVGLLEKVVEVVMKNHPDYTAAIENGRDIDMTPEDFVNLIKYFGETIGKYVDKSMVDQAYAAISSAIILELQKMPYNIDLATIMPGSPTFEKYKEGLALDNKYKKRSKIEIANRR